MIGIGGIGADRGDRATDRGSARGPDRRDRLGVCGAWYGTMFNHTKDIPFAAAMMGATLFLIRIARRLPSPRPGDIAAFGVLAGAALGIRVLGLLLVIYAGFAIALYLPRPWLATVGRGGASWSNRRYALLPALLLAYVIMILAWPWAALAPLNPIRGLLAFSEFHYEIRTLFAGRVYDDGGRAAAVCADLLSDPNAAADSVRRGAGDAVSAAAATRASVAGKLQSRDIALVSLTVIFPLACQVICHGPAFTGLRHFLFVLPALATLAGIGLDAVLVGACCAPVACSPPAGLRS